MMDLDSPMGSADKAHRLLAPRVTYLIGTRDRKGSSNVIPVSNVTSVSTDPQHVLLAIFKQWHTYQNLHDTEGFTLSVPTIDHLNGVWILGARYSHFPVTDTHIKLAECGLEFDYDSSLYGPVLTDGIGWMHCQTIQRIDADGDHGLFIGQVQRAWFNPKSFNSEGIQDIQIRPLMQISGNRFTAPSRTRQIAYYETDK